MLNQDKVKRTLGYPKVIVGIPVKPGSCWMFDLQGLVYNCLTGTIIHLSVLKHINYKIEEESKWKTVTGVNRTNECLKIDNTMLPSILVSWQFYFPEAIHIMPNIKQPYQIILGQDVIRAKKINADVAEGIFKWQRISKPMPRHGH